MKIPQLNYLALSVLCLICLTPYTGLSTVTNHIVKGETPPPASGNISIGMDGTIMVLLSDYTNAEATLGDDGFTLSLSMWGLPSPSGLLYLVKIDGSIHHVGMASNSITSLYLDKNLFNVGGASTLEILFNGTTYGFSIYYTDDNGGNGKGKGRNSKNTSTRDRFWESDEDPVGPEVQRFGEQNPLESFSRKSIDILSTPNPASESLAVLIPEYTVKSVQLMDLSGSVIEVPMRKKLFAESQTLIFDTRSLSQGLYFIKVQGEHTLYTSNFIKK
ncbi:MAG: T9SS type A sorting domain-containing protein [Bacteroidota bacterium]